jgi:hypothetical protein
VSRDSFPLPLLPDIPEGYYACWYGGQELGELASTACNTYANAGNVAQFDFHQSGKSKVSFPLLSFVSSNDVMESARAWYFMTLVLHCNRLQKHVQKSIIPLYLQTVTL